MSFAHIATWTVTSSPRRYPLCDTCCPLRYLPAWTKPRGAPACPMAPASADVYTWIRASSDVSAMRQRSKNGFVIKFPFVTKKNIAVTSRLFSQGRPNLMLRFRRTKFHHKSSQIRHRILCTMNLDPSVTKVVRHRCIDFQ